MANDDVYNKLSVPNGGDDRNQKWNFFLFSCCLVASLASFAFGYNIGVTNLPTPLIKTFYANRYFDGEIRAGEAKLAAARLQLEEGNSTWLNKSNAWNAGSKQWPGAYQGYLAGVDKYEKGLKNLEQLKASNADSKIIEDTEKQLKLLESTLNASKAKLDASKVELDTGKPQLDESRARLDKGSQELVEGEARLVEGKKKAESANTMLWTLTTAVFVVGGVIGAFTSKYVAEGFGRKKAIVFHYIFGVIAGILTLIAPSINSPECIIIGRFLFGVQGGMTCGLIPGYLNEISPKQLRGATGVMQQLLITIGILVSQVLGIKQILGTAQLWHILLSLSAVASIIGGVLLLLFFPDSPSSLINRDRDEDAARKALERLRQSKNVSNEIDDINAENREAKSDRSLSISEVLTAPELRWPLITSIVIQLTQQFSGVNAIFFYSESIFRSASIEDQYIQYAVLSTGLINVLATLIALPLIDRLGRKPLLVYPLLFIIVDFIALTFFLIFKTHHIAYSYLSIVCIVLFIVCFAVGLGPIPFVYVAEVFRAEARTTALSISMFTNWMANLILSLVFPYMNKGLGDYTFLVFVGIVVVAVTIIIRKVPETKGRSVDEIMAQFDHKYAQRLEDAGGKLMSSTNV